MNRITTILLPFFLIITNLGNAQKAITTYLDANWKPCSLKEAAYFRKSYKLDNKYWNINDYYLDGKIQMRGTFKTNKVEKKEGFVMWYAKNGQKIRMGNFKNNKPIGKKMSWFKNGFIESKGQFDQKGDKIGLWQGWYKNGNKSYIGNYSNNKMIGEWHWYFRNGQESSDELYKKGKLKHVEFFNNDGSKFTGKVKLFVKPKFIGGKNALDKYFRKNTKFDKIKKLKGIDGIVVIGFAVGIQGKIKKVRIIKSAGYQLNVEAARLVLNMPRWIPGKMHNRPVLFQFKIPINFNYPEYKISFFENRVLKE